MNSYIIKHKNKLFTVSIIIISVLSGFYLVSTAMTDTGLDGWRLYFGIILSIGIPTFIIQGKY